MRHIIVIALYAWLSLGANSAGCSDATRHGAVLAIAGAGPLVQQLQDEHQRVYQQAAEQVRMQLAADGGHVQDYDGLMVPINAEFDRRSVIIAGLSTSIYGAAAIVDASKTGHAEDYAQAADNVLSQIESAERELQREGPLAPLHIPPAAATVTAALRVIANSFRPIDAGGSS